MATATVSVAEDDTLIRTIFAEIVKGGKVLMSWKRMAASADAYITKPFKVADVAETLRRMNQKVQRQA